jgi:hypothetical protein
MWEYPALAELDEKPFEETKTILLFLPGQYGIFNDLYICFTKDSRAINYYRRAGCAVADIDGYDYGMAWDIILDCVKFKKKIKSGKSKSKTKRISGG